MAQAIISVPVKLSYKSCEHGEICDICGDASWSESKEIYAQIGTKNAPIHMSWICGPCADAVDLPKILT